MWKTSLFIFIILFSAISGMLFWQWDAYSKESLISGEKLVQAQQELTLETKGNSLFITQTINGLTPKKEFRLSVPKKVTKWKCTNIKGGDCKSKDDNPKSFLAEKGQLKLEYKVALNKKRSPILLNDWTIILPQVSMTNTVVEIVDTSKRKGTWIAGLPLKGKKDLDFVDYYVFEGPGELYSLYWQPNALYAQTVQKGLTYFTEHPKSNNVSFKSLNAFNEVPNISVIMTNDHHETNGKGLIITNKKIKKNVLERKLVYTFFENKFENLPLEEKWLLDVLTSLSVNQKSKIPKGNKVINELNKEFTKEELKSFLKMVHNEEVLNTIKMDNFIKNIKRKGTHFFSLNKNESTKFIPMYYYDERKVVINDKPVKGIEVIYQQESKLFPFIDILSALGFEVKVLSDQETLLLRKGSNSYRFYVNKNIFIYNEEDYGLLENPLTTFNGEIHIEQQWLQSLFKVSIAESNEEIKLAMETE